MILDYSRFEIELIFIINRNVFDIVKLYLLYLMLNTKDYLQLN